MIPVLFAGNATSFNNNGIGFLVDAISAPVTEERNGPYEATLSYPVTGQFFDDLVEGAYVKLKPNEISNPQLFQIKKVSKPINGIVTYKMEHCSYMLNGLPLQGLSIEQANPQSAMEHALLETPLTHNFSAWSDIATTNTVNIKEPISIRALLGGHQGSILDVWGAGEYEFDNFTIKLHYQRGADNGVTIEYGKNLTDLKQEIDISSCYTCVMPFAKYSVDVNGVTEERYMYLTEKVIDLTDPVISYPRCFMLDLSDKFGDGVLPTESAIRDLANAYIENNDLISPKVNITISFVQLWQTEEYKNIAVLERVSLCDTVNVRFPKFGINVKTKVIKTVYDSILERYTSMTLGDPKSSFADTIAKQSSELKEVKDRIDFNKAETDAELEEAIATATSLITGHSGGYVVLNPAEQPQEILVMDHDTMEAAVHVWRWNSGGLGYSSHGVGGPYELAMTSNGEIVADFIKTGSLSASLIKGGVLQLGSNLNQSGVLEVYDEANTLIATLDKSGLKLYGSDGFYLVANPVDGFAGYDKDDNKLFWVTEDEFHMKKSVIEEEITLCNKMRFIPIEIRDANDNIINDGIGLVSV
jgi:phage minor structural protein